MFTAVCLVSVLVNRWLNKRKENMAHQFREIYCDEVDFERMTHEKVIDLVFTEFVHRKIQELEKQETGVKVETDRGFWTELRNHCEISDEDERWFIYADKALAEIDCEDIWQGILYCCKIVKLSPPSETFRRYFDTLFNLSWFIWSKMYSDNERTFIIINLLDYIICVHKLRSQSPV